MLTKSTATISFNYIYPSLRPSPDVISRFPQDEFSWNLLLLFFFTKICCSFRILFSNLQKIIYFVFYFEDLRTFTTANFAFRMIIVVVAATVSTMPMVTLVTFVNKVTKITLVSISVVVTRNRLK